MNAQIIAFPGCTVPEEAPPAPDLEQMACDVNEHAQGLFQGVDVDDLDEFNDRVRELRAFLTAWLGDG
jgi:hypothetical protein